MNKVTRLSSTALFTQCFFPLYPPTACMKGACLIAVFPLTLPLQHVVDCLGQRLKQYQIHSWKSWSLCKKLRILVLHCCWQLFGLEPFMSSSWAWVSSFLKWCNLQEISPEYPIILQMSWHSLLAKISEPLCQTLLEQVKNGSYF